MENNKRQVVGGGGGGGSSSSLDHLFGPKDSFSSNSSSSSSSSGDIFGSIFSTPSAKQGRDPRMVGKQVASGRHGNNPDNNTLKGSSSKGENSSSSTGSKYKSSVDQNYEGAEPCYLSSSIYYGGQENYSPRTTTPESQYSTFKKDGGDQDPNGNNSASRGNWWQGSLYY